MFGAQGKVQLTRGGTATHLSICLQALCTCRVISYLHSTQGLHSGSVSSAAPVFVPSSQEWATKLTVPCSKSALPGKASQKQTVHRGLMRGQHHQADLTLSRGEHAQHMLQHACHAWEPARIYHTPALTKLHITLLCAFSGASGGFHTHNEGTAFPPKCMQASAHGQQL